MLYQVVGSESKKQLEAAVNELLDGGWQLQGGISVSHTITDVDGDLKLQLIYAQAMVKEL